MDDLERMRLAIEAARQGVRDGQTPFGACIVKGGTVIACEHNAVWGNTDITAHAEIQAIRKACAATGSVDLSGCVIYSTCEPCPMCFSAIHWARIDRIVHGAEIADAERFGFHEMPISNDKMRELGRAAVEIESGCLRRECLDLFEEWSRMPGHRLY